MSKQVTEKQQKFCEEFMLTRNLTKSALGAGYSNTFALKKSYQLMNDQKILKRIEELEKEYFTNHFKTLGIKAVEELMVIINSGTSSEKLRAIEIALKLNGFTQGISIEANTNDISIKVKLPDGI
ncbi:hypothetical protein GJV85_04300 [Sulfurimonas aquatica]|uniref:Terminase small subunit n=1 Tax=Sulfurimonas aquatica TaxID=2672570 RepID=A0A975AZI1_9BACT|nr:terminase small subunit [Sulfurimonas aquatica]QSZ41358.1 hypothetical protein GJV85_04300 [Sulfurimonas aquatica]